MKRIYKFRVRDHSVSWCWFGEAIITVFIQVNKCLNTFIHQTEQKYHRQISGLRVSTHTVK